MPPEADRGASFRDYRPATSGRFGATQGHRRAGPRRLLGPGAEEGPADLHPCRRSKPTRRRRALVMRAGALGGSRAALVTGDAALDGSRAALVMGDAALGGSRAAL